MPITAQQVVSIEYTLTDDSGTTLDSSDGRAPLSYLHGANNIVEGLERALEGLDVGANVEVTVTPAQGYGEYDATLAQNVAIRKLNVPNGTRAQVGARVGLKTNAGWKPVFIKAIKGDYAQVDGNHPLAGKTLHFKVKVVGLRAPTSEELAHGHVHGPGGHGH
jgi:FKBP-type peptidyl-prolyl cis-trans isomerase SlyD